MTTTPDMVQKEPEIIAFGDLTTSECLDSLEALLHSKSNTNLADFFVRVGFHLRQYLGSLPSSQQVLFPRFSTLVDLLAKWESSPGRPVLQLLFLSVLQSAQFIHHYGGYGTFEYPSEANTCIISSCAGNFTAAAASCSQSTAQFVPLAVEAALAAFRTGLKSFLLGGTLVAEGNVGSRTWSVSVLPTTGATVDELLGTFTESSIGLQDQKTIWVTARAPTGVTTLGGRPLVLSDFVTVNKDKLRIKWLDISSPYHAPHLFGVEDIGEIMEGVAENIPISTSSRMALLLAPQGTDTTTDFRGRLRMAVDGVLRQQLDLSAMFQSCGEHLSQKGARRCRLTTMAYGTTWMLSTALLNGFGIHLDVNEVSPMPVNANDVSGRSEQSKIAIVGYSGRFPSADSNEALWELLRAGRDVHREIPSDRFNYKTHYDREGRATNKFRVKHGCFVDSPGLFDCRFFNMSPREAENTDPAHRLAILTTYEAMEMAGFVRNRTPSTQHDRVGVFFGSTSDDWREINASQSVDTYFIPGGIRAFCPGRISHFFRLSGPSLSIDTACSSSFAALQTACSYLWSGQCDTAIAGGSNIMTNPNLFCGLDRARFLSTTGNCNAFDDEADGYCRADAVCSVILKRLEDAEADRDPILGVIVAAKTNHCGHAESITRPHEGDQAALFKSILLGANYDPLDVGVVEMHGTGTQVGDATEMSSVLSTFAPEKKRTETQPKRPLYVGSVKPNVGHAEAASGITSLIKVLLMLKHKEVPPHCGIKTKINRNYPADLTKRGVYIATQPTAWPCYSSCSKRAAFLNNFSAAGGNTAVLLEEAPRRRENAPKRPSDPSRCRFRKNSGIPRWECSIPRIVASASAGHVSLRGLLYHNGTTHPPRISNNATETLKAIPPPGRRPRITFAFTGQGSLYVGMGRELYYTYCSFRRDVTQFNQLAESYGFASFTGMIDGSTDVEVRSISVVTSHLALLCTQLALVGLLGRWGIKPNAVIGHSLGEYAALYAAGVISAGDAIFLVGKRASLLEQHCRKGTHGMLVVKASRQAMEHLLRAVENDLEVACANHPAAHVVAGPKDQMPAFISEAHKRALATVELDVPFAFHSGQVEPALAGLEAAAANAGVVFSGPRVPFISPLLGRVVSAGEQGTLDISYVTQASRRLVDFSAALTAAQTRGLCGKDAIWLDIGAHPLCAPMIRQTLGADEKVLDTLRENMGGCKTIAKSVEALYLAGMDMDWSEYHSEFPAAHRVLELPRYSWDLKNYWIDYRDDFCVSKGGHAGETGREHEAKQFKCISRVAQRVLEETHKQRESAMVVESDIFHPELLPVLRGHAVNGVFLCPSSLYAEIALTLGDYLLGERKMRPTATGLDMLNLRIDQPLIAKDDETSHVLRVTADADWTSNMLSLAVYSVAVSGKQTTRHATMNVRMVSNQNWIANWERNTHLVTSRVRALELGIKSQRLRRRMVYKLFSCLVDYSDDFKGMSEVLLDTDELEAVSTVRFQVGSTNSGLGIDARWIDSLAQISGFIMNANDNVNSQDEVFVNHGWERLRHAERLTASKTYRAYCRMQLVRDTTFAGNVFVLDGDRIVALYEGIKFIGMRRRALNHLLPAKSVVRDQKPVAPGAAPPSSYTLHFGDDAQTRAAQEPPSFVDRRPPGSSSGAGPVVEIICQELGIPVCDLDSESQLADLGIDSLLAMSITSRIQRELGLDVSSEDLLRHGLVGQLQHPTGCESSLVYSSSVEFDNCSNDSQLTSEEGVVPATSDTCSSDSSDRDWIRRALWETIACETATPADELSPSTSTADVGIDSLMAMTIAATICDRLSVNVTGISIMRCETLLDIEVALREILCPVPSSGAARVEKTGSPGVLADHERHSVPESTAAEKPHGSTVSRSSAEASVLLGGSVTTARAVLVLFPDGSGSAASYAGLAPTLHEDVAVYGVNCPWRKNGLELIRKKMTVSKIVAQQLVEVRRIIDAHKRHGWQIATAGSPNLVLGGWSAGGILAYEAIRQLGDEGVPVRKLLLLDSPDPFGLQIPSRKMSCFLEDVLKFGASAARAPDWVLVHFDGMSEVLGAYTPAPLPSNVELDTLLVYAGRGADNDYDDAQGELERAANRDIRWILRDRTDFTAAGWQRLLKARNLVVKIIDSVDHFTMMEDACQLKQLGNLVSGFVR
ncbi:polyketide synthase [Metarhizium album ARSEF 1941]|uniref:Polyketide synthase n=1 Tax=Metarhizium album (strain ARSEF 1941) TaxID=1081103 RepID=A0A0B2WT39_METAS|nr:polyketide synthase [Metarhizium album ARSEF 1941]KHN96135.1 polyketide synthase [Metarhizium album ARSEF 1941]